MRGDAPGPAQVRLAGGTTSELVDDDEAPWALVVGEPFTDVRARFGLGQRGTRVERDDRGAPRPPALVRDADDHGVAYRGVGEQNLLDLLGEDLLAAGVDDPAAAAVEDHGATGLEARHVAGHHPAPSAELPQGPGGGLGGPLVADVSSPRA